MLVDFNVKKSEMHQKLNNIFHGNVFNPTLQVKLSSRSFNQCNTDCHEIFD